MSGPVHALREALLLLLVLALPPLGAMLLVGLGSALLQTVTQLRERTLATVPRLVALLLTLAFAGAWMGGRLLSFLRAALEALPALGRT